MRRHAEAELVEVGLAGEDSHGGVELADRVELVVVHALDGRR